MKIRNFVLSAGAVVLLASCGNKMTSTDASLKTDVDSVSFFVGYNIGQSVKNSPLQGQLNVADFVAGMNSAMQGKELAINQQEMNMFIQSYFQKAQEEINQKNKQASEEFMAKKATEEGIDSLEGGVLYKVITKGEGEKPGPKDKVKVHYVGKLMNGEVFDSSKDHSTNDSIPEPTELPLDRVIAGWSTAIQNMPVGSKWEVYIPSDLAYGVRGAGDKIKPNSAIVFEIELVEIIPNIEQEATTSKKK